MDKKIFAGVILLSFFCTNYGMRIRKKESDSERLMKFYCRSFLNFSDLIKDQLTTVMLLIQDNPQKAVNEFKDSKNNNVFHLIFSSHSKLPSDFVNDAFNCCIPYLSRKMLKAKNDEGQNPFNLIEKLDDEELKDLYMENLVEKGFVKKTKRTHKVNQYPKKRQVNVNENFNKLFY